VYSKYSKFESTLLVLVKDKGSHKSFVCQRQLAAVLLLVTLLDLNIGYYVPC